MANHTSMIDFIILEQMTAFAVIMQKHPGWVGKRLTAFYVFLIIDVINIDILVSYCAVCFSKKTIHGSLKSFLADKSCLCIVV